MHSPKSRGESEVTSLYDETFQEQKANALKKNYQLNDQATSQKKKDFLNLLHKENIFDPLYNHHSVINNNVKQELLLS